MYLTKEEERMLEGEFGSGVAYSMRVLTKLGDAMDAERMIKPVSSHIVSLGYQGYGDLAKWCKDLDEKMLDDVKQFRISATTNPKFFKPEDKKLIEKFGMSSSTVEEIREGVNWSKKFEDLGAIPAYTCTPFFVYPIRKGEHLAGAESVAVVMYNSIYGAMLNRETGPTALSSAVTGITPEFGMHKPENRYARVQVDLDKALKPKEFTRADYSALGYYVGKIAMDRNVVFTGLPKDMSVGLLKTLLAPLGVSGAVMLAHVVGVTPEAPTLDDALMGRKPEEKIEVGKEQLEEMYGMLTTTTEDKADIAIFGCPHAPLEEINEISQLVNGKKIRDDASFLIGTAEPIKVLADRMGLTNTIEKCGGLIVTDICPHLFFNPGFIDIELKHSINTVATDCTKCAHYVSGFSGGKIKMKYGSVESCINAIAKRGD